MPLLLTQDDLRPLVTDPVRLDDALQAVEASVLSQAGGDAGHASWLDLPLADGTAVTLYATSPAGGTTLRLFPGVGAPGAARDGMVMLLLDPTDAHLVALLAGDDLNVLRTSLPAAVGVRHLARPGARVLGVLGSGEQARSHAGLMCQVVPSIEQVQVWSRTPLNRDRFVSEMSEALGRSVVPADDAEKAARGADIVTVATGGPNPPVARDWLSPGALWVTMTGGPPPNLVGHARFFVPSTNRPEVLAVARMGQAGPSGRGWQIEGTLHQAADVITGAVPARLHPDEVVVYGLASLYGWDAPVMRWAYDWAVANGVGTEFSLSSG